MAVLKELAESLNATLGVRLMYRFWLKSKERQEGPSLCSLFSTICQVVEYNLRGM